MSTKEREICCKIKNKRLNVTSLIETYLAYGDIDDMLIEHMLPFIIEQLVYYIRY